MYEILPTFMVLAAFALGFNLNILIRGRKDDKKAGGVGMAEESDFIA